MKHGKVKPARLKATHVTLAHGGGGRAMRDLIDEVFVAAFDNPDMGEMEDQARLDMPEGKLAFTTDSFVVDPLFFPGGDIGTLAVNGTVNDLAVGGAKPLYLSCAVIIEEGLEIETLRRVVASMRRAADAAGVRIVTGDTKVVGRGQADKIFITTTGVGVIPPGRELAARNVQPGDVVLVNNYLGDHGATILKERGELALEGDLQSDCAPLAELMEKVIQAAPSCRAARDATRGGIASALNEVVQACSAAIDIDEEALPLRAEIRGFCEILGLDPLYLANEGTLVTFVAEEDAKAALAAMQSCEEGRHARIVGRVTKGRPMVTLNTVLGGRRIVDMLVGEQLPRIC